MPSDKKSAKRPTRIKDLRPKTGARNTENVKGGRTTPDTSFGDKTRDGIPHPLPTPETTAK